MSANDPRDVRDGLATRADSDVTSDEALNLGRTQPDSALTSDGSGPLTLEGGSSSVTSEARTVSTIRRAAPKVEGYEILGELGRGGMGIVYHARQIQLNRPCALKMVLAGNHADASSLTRFLAEAEAVARLRHPNVVQIHAIGQVDGLPFFELEYVEGGSLDKTLDGTPWPAKRAARLVEALARAVGEAHRLGMVHRDLKPANILMDADGTPKITDFGLAKSLEKQSGLTATESILGTPSYMAPEQAEGRAREVDAASDVYSLGAIFYELLTGRPPFRGASVLETLEQVKFTEPVPPSRLVPGLARDPETIALKCLEKSPTRRYASAIDLAEDLRRFLDNEPITARPVLFWERILKWARRRPAIAALFVVVHVLLGLLLGMGIWSYVQIREALGEARIQEQKALAESERSRLLAASEAAARSASQRLSSGLTLHRALEEADEGQVGRALIGMAEVLRLAPDDAGDLRRVAAANLAELRESSVEPILLLTPGGPVNQMAMDASQRRLATITADGMIRIWDLETGAEVGGAISGGGSLPRNVAVSADGSKVIWAGFGPTRIWEVASGGLIGEPVPHNRSAVVHIRPGSEEFLDLDEDGVSRLRATNTGATVGEPMSLGHTAHNASFSRDGRFLALVGQPNLARIWDARTTLPVTPPLEHEADVFGVAFSPDGTRLATTTGSQHVDITGRLRLWDVPAGRLVAEVPTEQFGVGAVTFSPDGTLIATGGFGGVARLRDAETLAPIGPEIRHIAWVRNVAFSADGSLLATCAEDGRVRLCDGRTAESLGVILEHGGVVTNMFFAGDGRRLISSSVDGAVRVWDVGRLAPTGRVLPHRGVDTAEYSPDGRLIATAARDGTARLYDSETGWPVGPPLIHEARVRLARFNPDGSRLVTGGDDAHVRLWDVATGRPVGKPMFLGHWAMNAAFRPDGRRLLVGRVEGIARLFDLETFEPIGEPLVHPSVAPGHEIWHVAFSADGRIAITGSTEGTLGFWDAETGARIGEFVRFGGGLGQILVHGPTLYVRERGLVHTIDIATRTERGEPFGQHALCMALTRDGTRMALGGRDRVARIFDPRSGRQIGPPMLHPQDVRAIAFSPDDRLLLTGCGDGMARFWDAETCRRIGPPRDHRAMIGKHIDDDRQGVIFRPDGRQVAASYGHVTVWSVASPSVGDPARLAADATRLSGLEIDDQGSTRPMPLVAWKSLIDRSHTDVGLAETLPDSDWHDRVAANAEQHGPLSAALWHLDRRIDMRPDDPRFLLRRADVRRRLGDDARADRDESRAAQIADPAVFPPWLAHALFDRAASAREAGRWKDAVALLDRLASLLGDETTLRFQRAEAYARVGDWSLAAAQLGAAIDAGPVFLDHLQHQAALLLLSEDREGYARFCARRMERMRTDNRAPIRAFLATLLLLGPNGLPDYDELIALIEHPSGDPSADEPPLDPASLGEALLRAGRFGQAIPWLESGLEPSDPARSPRRSAFLAMAMARQGDTTPAHLWLEARADVQTSSADTDLWDALEIDVLRRELEATLREAAFPEDPFAR